MHRGAFPAAELAAAGYSAVHHSGGQWAGVAILAREGLELTEPVSGLPGEVRADQSRWIEATVAGLRVCSVYVVNGQAVGTEPFEEKLAFLEAMATRVGELGESVIVAGDMNVCPTDLDVYDPAAVRRRDPRHRRGARRARRGRRQRRPRRRLSRPASGARATVHLVGLPRRELPQGPRSANRSRARQRRDRRASHRGRHRARLPQGHQALRSRTAADRMVMSRP